MTWLNEISSKEFMEHYERVGCSIERLSGDETFQKLVIGRQIWDKKNVRKFYVSIKSRLKIEGLNRLIPV